MQQNLVHLSLGPLRSDQKDLELLKYFRSSTSVVDRVEVKHQGLQSLTLIGVDFATHSFARTGERRDPKKSQFSNVEKNFFNPFTWKPMHSVKELKLMQ